MEETAAVQDACGEADGRGRDHAKTWRTVTEEDEESLVKKEGRTKKTTEYGPRELVMTHTEVGREGHARNEAVLANGDPGTNWAVTVASLLVGVGFFALWFWLLPGWLGFHVDVARVTPWRWIAALPSVLGFAVALRCVWDFGRTGHGTPAPVAPPNRLVVVGFYRYVRNPMYVGFLAGWTGLWIVFGRASYGALEVAAVAVTTVALLVRFYEEPTLRKMFGAEYEEYCRNVRRWIPLLGPWKKK